MKHLLPIAFAALALASCQKPAEPQANEMSEAAQGPVKGADRTHKGEAIPAAIFNDPDGNQTSLKAFLGTPTLVNLWATWCAPCVKELPTLDRLAAAADGRLQVVAISQDMGPQISVAAFLKDRKVETLKPYHDPKMAFSGALGPDTVLPTTILYDAEGRELWRYVGDLDWTGEDAVRLLSEAGVATKG